MKNLGKALLFLLEAVSNVQILFFAIPFKTDVSCFISLMKYILESVDD